MNQKRKPIIDPKVLGLELRNRRKSLRRTLTEISALTAVNVGQLSRLENGHMKREGGNLQKFLLILQELEEAERPPTTPSLIERFEAIVERSKRHADAAKAFIDALEQLM
ncbi:MULTISPECIES: hypothetical protein [unclassified Delftia]|uniref:hypothetical protein n=1 Tax=unclassified Delftia TaxID=2613839 RepID=UPI001902AA32|nr:MULTISPECIES: hypothetical protein [unclassified Delftia]MBK0110960.1 hypothetical protein [Delftia sp. S65]MBK0116290.1 hypothetical protein [Delftia sp. S67]MBK0129794.1 hypothetical protein [Delftia sp. S66]